MHCSDKPNQTRKSSAQIISFEEAKKRHEDKIEEQYMRILFGPEAVEEWREEIQKNKLSESSSIAGNSETN
ncbi:hypothetical protein ACJU26_08250 [Acidithiobacillus sp. M4-SHS-6]|uniref:hypothetical protein n=1 Tax=Acidithiobacillus sp. M4-SHS-6 TaxID=3383024 RepID=UPI0039BDD2EC